MGHFWFWRWRKVLQVKKWKQPLEAGKGKGTDSASEPQSKKEHNPADTDFSSVKPISDF